MAKIESSKNNRFSERAVQNFTRWKDMVGLDPSFPQLRELPQDISFEEHEKYMFKAHRHLHSYELLKYKIAMPWVAVIVDRGQGATVFAKYTQLLADHDSIIRRILPVSIYMPGSFWLNGDDLLMDFQIRFGALKSLFGNPWYSVLPRGKYAELTGDYDPLLPKQYTSTQVEVFLNTAFDKVLKGEIKAANVWANMREKFKMPEYISSNLSNFISKFTNAQLKITLIADLSYGVSTLENDIAKIGSKAKEMDLREERVGQFASELKKLHNKKLLSSDHLSIITFQDNDALNQIVTSHQLNLPYDKIVFERYTWAEIFSMLNLSYSWIPKSISTFNRLPVDVTKLPLSAILDQKFVEKAYKDNKGLSDIIHDLNSLLLHELDKDWKYVDYSLQYVDRPHLPNHGEEK